MNMHRNRAVTQQPYNLRFSCSCLRTLSRKAWALAHLLPAPKKLYRGPESFQNMHDGYTIVIYEVLCGVTGDSHHYRMKYLHCHHLDFIFGLW